MLITNAVWNFRYIDTYTLVTMSISSPAKPKELARTSIGWTIQTLFPTTKFLFIGGTRGMYVMDRGNPDRPQMIGMLDHFQACDPVVVSDTIAYVTLRKGNNCGDARDVLLTVSIADPTAPKLISEYPVRSPYGLTINDSLLIVSHGYMGYGLYNAKDPANVTMLKTWTDFPTKDFIWVGTTLFVMGCYELRVVDMKDPMNPVVTAVVE